MMYLRYDRKSLPLKLLTTDQSFSIAYSASVGGLCTIIGNPPNLILNEFMNQQYKVHKSIWKNKEKITVGSF